MVVIIMKTYGFWIFMLLKSLYSRLNLAKNLTDTAVIALYTLLLKIRIKYINLSTLTCFLFACQPACHKPISARYYNKGNCHLNIMSIVLKLLMKTYNYTDLNCVTF